MVRGYAPNKIKKLINLFALIGRIAKQLWLIDNVQFEDLSVCLSTFLFVVSVAQ